MSADPNKSLRSLSWAPVTHTYNPSYSGGRDQEDRGSKPDWANILETLSWKKSFSKKDWWSGLRCRPWIQTPALKKRKLEVLGLPAQSSPLSLPTLLTGECTFASISVSILDKNFLAPGLVTQIWWQTDISDSNYNIPLVSSKAHHHLKKQFISNSFQSLNSSGIAQKVKSKVSSATQS
jgi:hypothetical protein